MTEGAISRLENGERSPSIEVAVALSKFFDVSVDYLLGITNNPNPAFGLDGLNKADINEPSFLKESATEKYGNESLANKKPGQDEINKLIEEELDEESVTELKKYAEYLRVRQTLDSGRDESSAGLDSGEIKEDIK
jgi:transcriptional regulator with XRE-family HTH domain